MAKKAIRTAHVLERINWRRNGDRLIRLAGSVRLASFDDPDEAEVARRERENAARAVVNPFTCGGPELHHQTSLDAGRLHDWILDIGLTPPKRTKQKPPDWVGWWEKTVESMNDYQREKMWEAFDRLRFHQVVERAVRPVVYVVVHINWKYNDNWHVAQEEGGSIVAAFRDRVAAQTHANAANDVSRSELRIAYNLQPEDDDSYGDHSGRLQARTLEALPASNEEKFVRVRDAVFYEVVEIEVEE